jgi:hypothetical protein
MNKMVILASFVLFGIIRPGGHQGERVKYLTSADPADVLFSCGYVSSPLPDDCLPESYGAYTDNTLIIADIIIKIMEKLRADSSMKLGIDFMTYECHEPTPVFKAMTTKTDTITTRYILYTRDYLMRLVNANTDWVAYGIFAHEIGHHLYQHTLSRFRDLEESRKRELKADYFEGFVLRKLDATLIQAQAGVNAMKGHPTDRTEEACTHPTLAKRLVEIQKGYEFAGTQGATTKSLLNPENLERAFMMEDILNDVMELFKKKEYAQALNTLRTVESQIPSKSKPDYFFNRGFIKLSAGDEYGAIKDYDKAIALDNSQFLYFEKRGEAKQATANTILIHEATADLKMAKEKLETQQAQIN